MSLEKKEALQGGADTLDYQSHCYHYMFYEW